MAPDKRSFEAAAESKREGISCGVTVASLASIPNLLLYAALAVYCLVAISHWNEGYIDFGDGNYLYISWRMANGAVLYRDVLAPQPPMHFVTGWILAKTAQLLNLPTLPTFRAFSVVLHALTAFLVARLTRLAASGLLSSYQATCAATLGGIFYLLLPIGFWWSSGFQSEPLEIVFLYAALLMLVHGNSTKTAVVGGILAALATLTNMTAAPYAVFFMIYLAVRERHKFAPFVSMFFAVWGSITALLEWKTGAYLENVIFNQVGAFPRKEFLPPGDSLFTYAWHKITSEGRDILSLEGGYIVLALVGLYLFLMKGRHTWPVELVGWGSLGFMASVVYVSKGGTMDYIFTIGEPAMAAFAALAVTSIVGWKRQEEESEGTKPHGPSTIPLLRLFIAIAATTVVCGPGIGFIWRTLKQETYELDEYRTRQVVELIRQHTGENDEILAPPFYAFLAKRRIICDYSEIFLWTLKYYNERQDKVRGAGVVTVERIANALREKKVKFVALDLDQTGKIPEIREAIANTYEQLRQSEFRTLNTRLMFFIPRDRSQAE